MTFTEFAWAIAPLTESCTDEFGPQMASVYYEALKDLSTDALRSAVGRHVAEAQDRWFPSIGKLRSLACEASDGRYLSWSEAWGKIREAARVWNQHCFERATQAREMLTPDLMEFVRRLGGFIALTEASADDLRVAESNFRSAWTSHVERQASDRVLPEHLRPAIADSRRLPAIAPETREPEIAVNLERKLAQKLA